MNYLASLRSRGFRLGLALSVATSGAVAAVGCDAEIIVGGPDGTSSSSSASSASGTQPQGAGGGNLYGVRRGVSDAAASFVRIDPATGVVTEISPSVPGLGFTPPVRAVIDPVRRRYGYEHEDYPSGTQHLTILDLDSGAVLVDQPFQSDDQIGELGVDADTGDFIMGWRDIQGIPEIVRIVPQTQELLFMSQVGFANFAFTAAAFDGVDTFYVINGESLVTVTASSGALGMSTVSSPYYLGSIQLDAGLGELVGFGRSDDYTMRLVTIDLATNETTALPTMPGVNHGLEGNAAYDPATHRFFFTGGPEVWQGVSYWVTGDQLFTVDATTGALLGTSPTVATNDPIYGIQFAP